ncbi:MAG: aminoglycoside phosphotransferase family protein [Bacteroidota bacterium]
MHDTIVQIQRIHNCSYIKTLSGGTSAFTCVLKKEGGEQMVGKIPFKNHDSELEFKKEVDTLMLAHGVGYAKVLYVATQYEYVLLELLGKPLAAYKYSIEAQIEIIVGTLKEVWQAVEENTSEFVYPDAILDWFQNFTISSWEDQNQPFSDTLKNKVEKAIAERRARIDPNHLVLIHGDAHNKNILKDNTNNENGFKFIDPDGIICEPAYDLAVLMREWIDDLFPDYNNKLKQRLDYLTDLTACDPTAIWQWTIIQLTATGLVLNSIDQHHAAKQMFQIAENCEIA